MTHIYNPTLQAGLTSSSTVQTTISPITGEPIIERPLLGSLAEVDAKLAAADEAYRSWRKVPLEERIRIVTAAVDLLVSEKAALGAEITTQMGRPVRYGGGEIGGFEERARWLIANAEKALADESVDEGRPEGLKRVIRRAPVGVCLLVGAWNFPYLIQINALLPALLAGNTVILKPSPQTPISSERIAHALVQAGLPANVCQVLHLTPDQMDHVVAHPTTKFVSFTGSVDNGKRVDATAAAAGTFKSVGLELGGKDAAYVREGEWRQTIQGRAGPGARAEAVRGCEADLV